MITFGSGCSGIEAASVAWEPLGFKPQWFAQFDPEHDYANGPDYPSAVLQHHWPHIPNLGDLTTVRHQIELGYEAPDVFVAGTPCQAYSVAGMREGLADARGALTLEYVKILDTIDEQRQEQEKPACVGVWENVPGVLSSADNAFGCLLGGLAGSDCELEPGPRPAAGKGSRIWRWCKKTRRHLPKWTNAGCVFGPKRAVAWRILDAQYFGVAQRRRRVFVVASAREGFDPVEVLLEFEGLRRDTPPSREAGQEAARNTGGSFKVGSHWDGEGYAHPTLSQSHNTGGIGASNQELFSQRGAGLVSTSRNPDGDQEGPIAAFGQNNTQGPVNVSHCLNAHAGPHGRLDFESETFLVHQVAGTLLSNGKAAGSATQQDAENGMPVVHGTQDPDINVNLAHTLGRNQGQENAVCVTGDITHTLKAEGFDGSEDGTGQGTPITPVAFAENSSQEVRLEGGDGQVTGALSGGGGKVGQGYPAAMVSMALRRLTPVECERLQGFPDGYTDIPYRGKPAADGHRYKALGNSKAIPVVAWLGKRIKKQIEYSEFDSL